MFTPNLVQTGPCTFENAYVSIWAPPKNRPKTLLNRQ